MVHPFHLVVDGKGLKLCGASEWLIEKHGTKARRTWRKLHLGLNVGTGQIVAAALTTKEIDDGAQTGALLDEVVGPVASFTADRTYDQEGVSTTGKLTAFEGAHDQPRGADQQGCRRRIWSGAKPSAFPDLRHAATTPA